MNDLLSAGLILLLGFIGARALRIIHLPSVTAFLLVGIVIGPQVLGVVTPQIFGASEFISNLVLGLIAFGLGESFRFDKVRQGMKQVMWISIIAALGAWLLVSAALLVYFAIARLPLYPAIVLGAAAAATAPAATVLVIREYRAGGPVTDLLLKVVAIDDAWCLIISAVVIAVGNAMRADVFEWSIVFTGLGEIFGALLIGAVLGYVASRLSRFVRTNEELLIYMLGALLFNVGLSIALEISVLLSAMAMGFVMANTARENDRCFEVLRSVDTPLYIAFFIVSGAHLDFKLLYTLGIAGILYVLFRTAGKVWGARLGAKVSGAPRSAADWLGLSLTPQAGVALGVGLMAKASFPEYGDYIFTIIAATSVIFELAGPLLTKYSLVKAGEIARN
ncbi:cation:proton antiporter [candidate division WOR-3 bacterium]|nr:cation:proton antiporter [candidate division WOR-3 bacterium]